MHSTSEEVGEVFGKSSLSGRCDQAIGWEEEAVVSTLQELFLAKGQPLSVSILALLWAKPCHSRESEASGALA